MEPIETTNGKLAKVRADIEELIDWAWADADHATENDAPDTAEDDKQRAKLLHQALKLLHECER
jgi:ribosomal protein L17